MKQSTLTKPPLKKRKVEEPFKPPAKADVTETVTATQPLPDDSQSPDLSFKSQKPITPNGAKLDARYLRVDESQSDDSDTENSADAQDDIFLEEQQIRTFREEARRFLLENGQAFFHCEAMAFLRSQEKKKKEPLSDITPARKATSFARWK